MVPAGDITTGVIEELADTLESGDIVIDGGNSYYRDDIGTQKCWPSKGIHLLDCGTSGGVWGRDRGYCLMIGGDEEAFAHAEPIFASVAPGVDAAPRTPGRDGEVAQSEKGYLHCGPGRCGPLREDGAQRHRVRDDGLARRGPEHPAQRRHRQPHRRRATRKPRRWRIPSTTSTTSTSQRSPRYGGGAASSAPGCWI